MLLSAGLGLRFRPLTEKVPKPAIPVLGRPMVVQNLQRLARHGFDPVVVNLHHRPEVIERLVREAGATALPTVVFSREEQLLGTGGGLRRAGVSLRGNGPILVHNGDFLSDIDLRGVVREHVRSGRWVTLVLAPAREGFSRIDVAADGAVLAITGRPAIGGERPATTGRLFTGCHVLEERVLDLIPPGGPSDIVRDVYLDLVGRGLVGSVLHDGFWWEFGAPGPYLEGSLRLIDLAPAQRVEVASHDPVRRIGDAFVSMGAGAEIAPGARIAGRAALGLASHLAGGARLKDSVVMPEAWIGPGARLSRCVVGPGVEVPAGFVAEGSFLGSDGSTGLQVEPLGGDRQPA